MLHLENRLASAIAYVNVNGPVFVAIEEEPVAVFLENLRHAGKLPKPGKLSDYFLPNVKVSDPSQPPLTPDLAPAEPAGSGSLHRRVELSRCAAMVFEHFGVDCQAASPRKPTTMAVYEKH
jgi:hypothetical protein